MRTFVIPTLFFDIPRSKFGILQKMPIKEKLEELEVYNGRTIKGSSYFIPTPFLRCVLINAGTNNPLDLIPMVIHAGEKFDREMLR